MPNKRATSVIDCPASMLPTARQRSESSIRFLEVIETHVSGDNRVQWSDETRQLLYVLATWEDLKIIPRDLIGISLSELSLLKRDYSTFSL
ncbi:hypothetical protein TNCV_995111 [Trichonephila clavipes]|nr:hypothetical protein TNCV_995111 [Trichonephila clavipes]